MESFRITMSIDNLKLLSWTHDNKLGALSVWTVESDKNKTRFLCDTFTGRGHEITLNIVKVVNYQQQ